MSAHGRHLSLAFWIALAVAGCVLDRQGTRVEGDGSGGDATVSSTATTSSATGGSGGASSASGGTSNATVSSSSAGGDGGGATESSCLNGLDDDGDGKHDCEDPDCQAAGYTCLSPATGALGHLVVSASCPNATQPKTFRRCDAAACSCTGTQGSCSFGVARWNGSSCSGSPDSSQKTTPGCYFISAPTSSAFGGTTSPDGNSTCSPATATIAADDVNACEVAGGTCAGGGSCVPPAFPNADACVLLPAGSSCAAPYDGFRARIYDDPASTCDCSCNKTGATCSGSVYAYPNDTCADPPSSTVPLDGQCHPAGTLQSYYITQVISQPQCSPEASIATGARTLCCKQPP